MKVLHVTSGLDPRGGGTTSALAGMVTAQHEVGLDVTVFATHPARFEPTVTDQLATRGVDVTTVGPVWTPLGLHRQLGVRLRAAMAGAQVVHIHALWEQVQHNAARLARAVGVPYVISPHGMLAPWSLAQGRLKKRLYMLGRLRRHLDRATALHFTTHAEHEAVRPLALQAPVVVEPLGVTMEEFEPLPERGGFRRANAAVGDEPMIVFLGRVHPGKGLEYLIPAMREVLPADARLAVVGPDSSGYMQAMRGLAVSAGVSDRVIFTGLLSGVERISALVDAQLLCLPSDHENFGIVVIEALASGVPVIVSDRVGVWQEIAAEGVGEVVTPAIAPIAEALTRWLADHERRAAAGARARTLARERYDWRRIGEQWIGHYRRLAASS